MANDAVSDYILDRLQVQSDLSMLCSDLLDTCLHKNSMDNMTAMLITFPNAPKCTEEGLKREEELHSHLEQKLKDVIDKNEYISDVPHVMQLLVAEDVRGLPPGGGLASKRTYIESLIRKLKPSLFGDNQN